MHGKYHDPRVYQHFVHTYSRVPYLDHEIFNVENHAACDSYRASKRALVAQQGLDRTKEKSQKLQAIIKEARTKKEEDTKEFMSSLEKTQEACLQKEKQAWSDFAKQQEQRALSNTRDQLYLGELLKTNSTRAESRLTNVRRWS